MRHCVYRNLSVRDTFFGLDLTDLVIMSVIVNLVFGVNTSHYWVSRLLNFVIIVSAYLFLSVIKSKLPKKYLSNLINFLFKSRCYLARFDTQLRPLYEVISERR